MGSQRDRGNIADLPHVDLHFLHPLEPPAHGPLAGERRRAPGIYAADDECPWPHPSLDRPSPSRCPRPTARPVASPRRPQHDHPNTRPPHWPAPAFNHLDLALATGGSRRQRACGGSGTGRPAPAGKRRCGSRGAPFPAAGLVAGKAFLRRGLAGGIMGLKGQCRNGTGSIPRPLPADIARLRGVLAGTGLT
jgi:hypothetical protein